MLPVINSLHPIEFALELDYNKHKSIPKLIDLLFEAEDKIFLINRYNHRLETTSKKTKDAEPLRLALVDIITKDLTSKLKSINRALNRIKKKMPPEPICDCKSN